MLKIDVCSDLHVDAWFNTTQPYNPNGPRIWEGEPYQSRYFHIDWQWYKNEGSTVLVIAGDTANNIEMTAQVVSQAASVYEHVVLVDGNHEHYESDGTVEQNMSRLKSLLSQLTNVSYLNGPHALLVGDVMFIGATGWYDWKGHESRDITVEMARQAWKHHSMDSRRVKYGIHKSPANLGQLQADDLAERVREVSDNEMIREIVVVTHMSPCSDLMEWKEGDNFWNLLTPSYINSQLKVVLEADVNRKIKNWVYGHTHQRKITEVDGVKYINNARGYPRENPPFSLTQITIE